MKSLKQFISENFINESLNAPKLNHPVLVAIENVAFECFRKNLLNFIKINDEFKKIEKELLKEENLIDLFNHIFYCDKRGWYSSPWALIGQQLEDKKLNNFKTNIWPHEMNALEKEILKQEIPYDSPLYDSIKEFIENHLWFSQDVKDLDGNKIGTLSCQEISQRPGIGILFKIDKKYFIEHPF